MKTVRIDERAFGKGVEDALKLRPIMRFITGSMPPQKIKKAKGNIAIVRKQQRESA